MGRRITGWLEGTAVWPELDEAVELSARDNVFFTPYMQRRALEAIAAEFLNEGGLGKWLEKYPECGDGSRVCGVVAAGNIPAVAFQDVLSVLAAGWRPVVKLSSKDRYLLPVLFPDVEFCGSVSGWHADALITMGGDAAAEYFRKNFPEVPKLIRAFQSGRARRWRERCCAGGSGGGHAAVLRSGMPQCDLASGAGRL